MSVVASARRKIHALDPDQPVSNIRTMEGVLDEEIGQRRLGMTLVAVFAGLAILLASLGIYGVLSYFVVQHRREIGVRLALGAQRRDILSRGNADSGGVAGLLHPGVAGNESGSDGRFEVRVAG